MSRIFFIFLTISLFGISSQQDKYTATVLSYYPNTNEIGLNRLLINSDEYKKKIETTNSDIIIFPEYGLTGFNIFDNLDVYATVVPDPRKSIKPWANQEKFSKFLIDLSGNAKNNNKYVVVNLIEKSNTSDGSAIYYNTNVVFNREGEVIARYRKINLYEEPGLTAGNEIVTFKTDFGVTFGIMTCFDIVHKKPAIDMLKNGNVTDVIYPTAWLSEMPHGISLSVQAGYALSNRVNLLAAGLVEPSHKIGGSGIYSYNGDIQNVFISGSNDLKAITDSLQKREKIEMEECTVAISPRGIGGSLGGSSEISKFMTNKENLEHYSTKTINKPEMTETVCSNKHCCKFEIKAENLSIPEAYVYKMAVFYGSRNAGNNTIGVRICSIIACLSDDVSSCGDRNPNVKRNTVKFTELKISGSFPKTEDTYDQPATLRSNLEPISNVKYCSKNEQNSVNLIISTTTEVDDMLTFGLYGRVFNNDNKTAGPINNGNIYHINIFLNSILLLICVIIF